MSRPDNQQLIFSLRQFRRCLLAALCLAGCPSLQAATLTVNLLDQNGEAVNDAVVYISSSENGLPASTPMSAEVDQIDENFVPHVRAVTTGSQVRFPNSDHIRHHVYSFSEARFFELPLYIGEDADPVTFDRSGVVTLGCNIHDHMLGYILVLDSPLFAEVIDGRAAIDDLPDGQMTVAIWHPRLESGELLEQQIQASAEQDIHLQLTVSLLPERMVRRAPRRNSRRY